MQMSSDDVVQQLSDASVGIAGGLLEAGLGGGRDAPSVHFALPGHALQCNAKAGSRINCRSSSAVERCRARREDSPEADFWSARST
jgi:hypothetical protein